MPPAENTLPPSLERRLRRLRLRWQALRLLHGTGLFLLCTIALLSTGLLVDILCPLPFAIRLVLLTSTCLGTVWAFYRLLLAPLKTGISNAELAALVEREHPELQERLSSSVELFDESLPASHRGSDRLRELLAEETLAQTDQLDFGGAVGFRSARVVLAWSCLSLAVLLLPLGDSGSGYPLLMMRFFQPWSNLQRVTLYEINVRGGDRVAPRGSDVRIEVLVTTPVGTATRPGELWCHWTTRSGTNDRRLMEPTTDGTAFTTTWPEVLEGFDFVVSAESSRSRTYRVDVVEPPRLVGITLDIQPPAYTGLPARTTDVVFGDVPVFAGSGLTFRLSFNKPLDHGTLELTPVAQATDDSGTNWDLVLSKDGLTGHVSFVVSRGGPLTVDLADHDGLAHQDKTYRQLVLVEDAPPTLILSGHDAPQAVRPGDLVEFRARATDDFGLTALQLLIEVDTEQGKPRTESQDVEPSQLGGRELTEDFAIDLARFGLHDGDTVTYRVRATDGRPLPGPNETWSQPRTLLIDLTAEPPGTTDVARRQAELKQLIEKARRDAAENRKTLEEIRQQALADLKGQREFQGDAAIRRAAADERELATRIDRLARRLDNLPLFRDIAPTAREVARTILPAATERLEPAAQAPLADKATRLAQAGEDLVRAERKLEELSSQFDKLAELERDLLELGRLARQAGQLAEDVEQLARQAGETVPGETPAEQKQRRGDFEQTKKALGNRQGELAGQLDDLMQRRPEIVEAARQDQLDLLQDLARQAQELAEPQEGLGAALQRESAQAAKELSVDAAAQGELNRKTEALARRSDATAQHQATAPLDATAARQALDRLKRGNRQAARGDQQRAAAELERLAEALTRHTLLPADPAEALRELARRQSQLAESIARPQPAADSNASAPTGRQRRLATEQLGLNAALAGLSLPPAQQAGQQQAAKAADRTVEDLLAGKPRAAVKSAADVARKLEELAKSLGESPPTPRQLEQLSQQQQQQLAAAAKQTAALAHQQARLQQQVEQLDPRKPDPAALKQATTQQAQLEKQGQALPRSMQGPSRRAAQEAMKQARKALAEGETASAASRQARATAALRDLQQQATALANTTQTPPAGVLAEQARQLAQQQRDLAKQQEVPPVSAKEKQPQLAETPLGQQQQLAREATRLAIDVAAQTGTRSAASQESARFARQAAEAAQQALGGQLDQARQQAEAAQATAQQAARALDEVTDPQPDPALGRRTRSLAERQARLAGEFQRMQQTTRSRRQARQLAQESLAEATRKLSEDLGEAIRRLEGKPLELPTPASQARDARAATDQGQQAMDRSGENIAQANPGQAASNARQAARALQQASRLARGAAQANQRPETPVPGQVGRQVAEASQELDRAREGLDNARFSEKNAAQASRTGSPSQSASPQGGQKQASSKKQPSGKKSGQPSGQQSGQPSGQQAGQQPGKGSLTRSAQQLRRASQSLARASQQLQPGKPGQPQPGDPRSAPPGENSPSSRDTAGNSGSGSSVAMELQRLEARLQRLSGRSWGRLPGKLRTEILQAARRDPNGDYARLIRFYFREIAREGRGESEP